MNTIHPHIVTVLEKVLPVARPISAKESNKPNGAKPEELGWDAKAVSDENLETLVREHGVGTLVVSAGPWDCGAILDGCRRFRVAERLGVDLAQAKVEALPCADLSEAKRLRWKLNISTKRTVPSYLVLKSFFKDADFQAYFESLAAQGRQRMQEGGRKGGKSNRKGKGKAMLAETEPSVGGFNRRLEVARFCMVKPWEVYYAQKIVEWEKDIANLGELAPEVRAYVAKAERGLLSTQSVYMHLHNHLRRNGRGSSLDTAAALPNQAAAVAPTFAELDKVYHGDCLEVMPSIPSETVDRIITSPPYFAHKVKYGDDWKGFATWEAYEAFTASWLDEAWRLLKADGVLCINIDDTTEDHSEARNDGRDLRDFFPSSPFIIMHLRKLGCRYFQQKVWTKKNMSGKASARGSVCAPNNRPNHEPLIFAFKGKRDPSTMIPTMDERELNEWTVSTWDIAPACDPLKQHPCIYPPELARRLVLYGGSLGDVVLDPFCGVGTSLFAAASEGRKYIGIERHSIYANRAEEEGKKGQREWEGKKAEAVKPRPDPDF